MTYDDFNFKKVNNGFTVQTSGLVKSELTLESVWNSETMIFTDIDEALDYMKEKFS